MMRKNVEENRYHSRNIITENDANDATQRQQRSLDISTAEDPLLGSTSIDDMSGITRHRHQQETQRIQSSTLPVINKGKKSKRKRKRGRDYEEYDEEKDVECNNNTNNSNNKEQTEDNIDDDNDVDILQPQTFDEINLESTQSDNEEVSEINVGDIVHPDPLGHSPFSYNLGDRSRLKVTQYSPKNKNNSKEENDDDNEEVPVSEFDRSKGNRNRSITVNPRKKRRVIGRTKNKSNEYERKVDDVDYIFHGSKMRSGLTLIAVDGRFKNMSSYVSYFLLIIICFIYKYVHIHI